MTFKARILVVDDDRLVLATVTHGLTQAGYEVIDADNGDEAILLGRQHRPDLALLDIRMEGLNGFDVAEALRGYGIPFMFLSAFADPTTLAKVHAMGALDHLVKPLDVGQIVPRVESALQRSRQAQSHAQLAQVPPAPRISELNTTPAGSHPAASVDPVILAMGVLMHRHSLTRDQARERLTRMAQTQGHSPEEQAQRLLAAVEELARTAL